jgi:ribonuclease BN (tRNA processing enzyme)
MATDRRSLQLLFLGSGNAFAPQRYWNSFLLNDRYLFDPSPVALPHLKMLKKDLHAIDVIFISHFHGDHFFGLPFLLLEYGELNHRTRDLVIVGPRGLREKVETVTEAGFPGLLKKSNTYRRRYLEVDENDEQTACGLPFQAVRVEHVSNLECYGFQVRLNGMTLAYSGDAALCDGVWRLAKGADVFVIECSSWEAIRGLHMSPDDVRELRKQTPPEMSILLTHMDAGKWDFSSDGIQLVEDLASYNFRAGERPPRQRRIHTDETLEYKKSK